LLDNVVVVVVV